MPPLLTSSPPLLPRLYLSVLCNKIIKEDSALHCGRQRSPQTLETRISDMSFLKIPGIFLLCVDCSRRYSYLYGIGRLSGVRYNGRHRESLCASGLRSPELSAQVRRRKSCTSCILSHMDASITRTSRNGRVCVEDGRGRRPGAFVV